MRIERINEIQEVLKCVPFEQEIRNKKRDNVKISKTILFLQSQLDNPYFGFWIGYDDNDNVLGYTVAMITAIPGMERLHVLRMYAKQKDLKEKFEGILKKWAKENKIKIAQMTAIKNVKAFARKYKWRVVSVNLERRI